MPQRFFVHGQAARGDRHVYASRTRFIPASILGAFEQTSWASVQAKDDRRRQPQVRVDLGARMRNMWK
jgi:DNA helicase-2/ATP-dependent DNA helicase PcrA